MERLKLISRLAFLAAALLVPAAPASADDCAAMDYYCQWWPEGMGFRYSCTPDITCEEIGACVVQMCEPTNGQSNCDPNGSQYGGPSGFGGCYYG